MLTGTQPAASPFDASGDVDVSAFVLHRAAGTGLSGTFSYAYNAWIAQPERYDGPYRVVPTEFRARDLADIPDPAGTILLFDVTNSDSTLRGMVETSIRKKWSNTPLRPSLWTS